MAKNGKGNKRGKKDQSEQREYVERFPIAVTVRANLSVDKNSFKLPDDPKERAELKKNNPEVYELRKKMFEKVAVGGEHTSVFYADMTRDQEKTREIIATFPEGFTLAPKTRTFFEIEATEFMRPDLHIGGVVCTPGGHYLKDQAHPRDFSRFIKMNHVTTVKAVGNKAEWEVKTHNLVASSKRKESMRVVEESWILKMPRAFATRFHLDPKIVASMPMPSVEELTKEVEAKVDTLPTELKVDWQEEPVDLQAKIRPLVTALVASFMKACGVKLWFKDMASAPPVREEETAAETSETTDQEEPIPMPGEEEEGKDEAAEG